EQMEDITEVSLENVDVPEESSKPKEGIDSAKKKKSENKKRLERLRAFMLNNNSDGEPEKEEKTDNDDRIETSPAPKARKLKKLIIPDSDSEDLASDNDEGSPDSPKLAPESPIKSRVS